MPRKHPRLKTHYTCIRCKESVPTFFFHQYRNVVCPWCRRDDALLNAWWKARVLFDNAVRSERKAEHLDRQRAINTLKNMMRLGCSVPEEYEAAKAEQRKRATIKARPKQKEAWRAKGYVPELARKMRDQWRNFRKSVKARGLTGKGKRIPAGFLQSLLAKPCPYCGADLGDDYHLDHIIPVTMGGPNETWNIQATCPPCNMAKKDTPPWLFATESVDANTKNL